MTQAVGGTTGVVAQLRSRAQRVRLEEIAASITERDQRICVDLYEHIILTTTQIYELHFSSYSRARTRTLQLHQLGLLRRTRPYKRPGSLPWHYLLDSLGALVVAEHRGIEASELGFRPDRALGIIDGQNLRHLRAMNGFFTRLAWACRRRDDYALARWWSERWCRARWNGLVSPDGAGRLDLGGRAVTFFLELDRGTENRGRLENKLDRYRLIAGTKGAPNTLLFCFHSAAREASARSVLSGCGLVVATTSLDRHAADPLAANWRPLDADRRVALGDLSSAEAMQR